MAGQSTSEQEKKGAGGNGATGGKNVRFRRGLYIGLGVVFLLLGIAGMFLPFLQGFLFLFVSLFFFSRASPRMRLGVMKLRQRYPRAAGRYDAWMDGARDRLRRIFRRGR